MESTGITEWFENKKKQLVAISPTSKLRLNYIMFVEMWHQHIQTEWTQDTKTMRKHFSFMFN